MESIKYDDGNTKVLIEGLERGRILESHSGDYFSVTIKVMTRSAEVTPDIEKKMADMSSLLESYSRFLPRVSCQHDSAAEGG